MDLQGEATKRCPCGNPAPLAECCGRFLSRTQTPARAEELMRSRYTAYVLGDLDYLMDTHDPETRQPADRDNAARWIEDARWRGLEVVESLAGGPDDQQGVVEFKARYMILNAQQVHHERSTFRRVDGRWVYVRGEPGKRVARASAKVGRNDPCPCGSGKKFKKCCGSASA